MEEEIKKALEKMDKNYCNLSKLNYSDLELSGITEELKKQKYLERPFAYEFYHQLRKLIENKEIDLGNAVVQAEVDKRYQSCFAEGKIPDFIIHEKGKRDNNLCVIEVKIFRGDNSSAIKDDLDKLLKFKKGPLKYKNLCEVVIGKKELLKKTKRYFENLSNKDDYKEINIILFDVDSWKVEVYRR